MLEQFSNEKLLGADNTYNHCNGWPDDVWRRSANQAARSMCAQVRPAIWVRKGIPAFQKALDHGLRPAFSIDNETSYGTDMFTEMRVAFNIQRAMATYRAFNKDPNPPAMVRCVKSWNARRSTAR